MTDRAIAERAFAHGQRRTVYLDANGRRYVRDSQGRHVVCVCCRLTAILRTCPSWRPGREASACSAWGWWGSCPGASAETRLQPHGVPRGSMKKRRVATLLGVVQHRRGTRPDKMPGVKGGHHRPWSFPPCVVAQMRRP